MIGSEEGSSGHRLRLLLGSWRSLVRKIDLDRSRLTIATRTLYWLNGATQSMLQQIQKRSYSEELATVIPPPPLFVLGFWRSGTTLLHELLCCDSNFGFPSTYACLNPAHFLLSERWTRSRSQQQVRRPMDHLRYSWASPQEDEFALLALGAPSAYEALIVPSLMSDVAQLLDLYVRPVSDQERWYAIFQYFLKLLTVQQGKPMALKSPTHGYRIQTLCQKFPLARYVVIERNPYEVFASNLKLWRTLTDRYGQERCTDEQLEEFILAAYVLHEKRLSRGIHDSRPGSVVKVRYEELIKDPIQQMSRIYVTLQLGDYVTVRPCVEAYLAHVSDHVRNRFRLSRSQKARIDMAWADIIAQKEYTWPSAYIDLE
jgi:hypothetical protein